MSDDPSLFELLAASIRKDPETWLPVADDSFPPERAAELTDRIIADAQGSEHQRTHPDDQVRAAPPMSRRRHLLVAAMIVGLVTLFAGVFGPRTGSAHAAVTGAAEALGRTASLEGNLTTSSSEGTSRSTIAVSKDAFQIRDETTYADGHRESAARVMVDGYLYETVDGLTTRTVADPDSAPAPFARSSRAVIDAVAGNSNIDVIGNQDLGGLITTRYDIRLDAGSIEALSKLRRDELAWFELEYPDQVDTVQLWISDGMIHQMEIHSQDQWTRLEFHSFGEPVHIEAPPGPYVD